MRQNSHVPWNHNISLLSSVFIVDDYFPFLDDKEEEGKREKYCRLLISITAFSSTWH